MNLKIYNSNLIALMLAGGSGVRMGDSLRGKPKCLMSIRGEPLILYTIKLLKQQGISDLLISTRPEFAPQIIEVVKNQSGINIKIIENSMHDKSLLDGFAAAIVKSGTDAGFLLLLSDIIYSDYFVLNEINPANDYFFGEKLRVPYPETYMIQGLMEYEPKSHKIEKIAKYAIPRDSDRAMKWSGMVFCGDKIADDLSDFFKRNGANQSSLEDFFQFRLERNRLAYARVCSDFVNINTTKDAETADTMLSKIL